MKVLCFTTSYHRLEMVRRCILDVMCQSYPNIYHAVNIVSDKIENLSNCSYLFDDLDFDRIKISYNSNSNQHINYMAAIKSINHADYDIFVKIDDDDLYKKDYIKLIVDAFKNLEVDIVSSRISSQLNGNIVRRGEYNSLGGNPDGYNYKMPMTFAFNRKALNLIIDLKKVVGGFEDNMWRNIWSENKLKHMIINNEENIVWHIHGKNISTRDFLIKE
jgi:hypothetical protein